MGSLLNPSVEFTLDFLRLNRSPRELYLAPHLRQFYVSAISVAETFSPVRLVRRKQTAPFLLV